MTQNNLNNVRWLNCDELAQLTDATNTRNISGAAYTNAVGFCSPMFKANVAATCGIFYVHNMVSLMGEPCETPQGVPASLDTGLQTRTVSPTRFAAGAKFKTLSKDYPMNALSIGTSAIRQFDGLYSLNDLHVASGSDKKHQPSNFLRVEQTQALINEINRSSNMRNALKVKRGGDFQGTFACKELVYAYAMWISPAFMLQVIRAYDALVTPKQLPAPQIQLATSQQRLHLRRTVEAKAKALGGSRGDFSLVWRKVHDVCGGKLNELTPTGYKTACAYFQIEPLTGDWEHEPAALPAPTIPTDMQIIPNLAPDEYFRNGQVFKLNVKNTMGQYGNNSVLVPFSPKRPGIYEVHVRDGIVHKFIKSLGWDGSDYERNFALG